MATIDTNGKITIYAAAAIVLTAISSTWYLASAFYDLRSGQTTTSSKIDALQQQFTEFRGDQMTKSLAAEIAMRNAMRNPGISFTDPRDPNVAILVDGSSIKRLPDK